MKRNYLLLIFIFAFLALLSGNLTAGISLVGNLGISFFYKQFSFFTSWWQSALFFFAAMMLIFLVLYFVDKALKGLNRKIALIGFFILFLAGLYFTFRDFRTDITHRWLGARFHAGIYLYWIGWGVTSLFFALTEKKKPFNNLEQSPDLS
ncbi:cytochrome d ubiquinol oxidase subunit II [Niabella insulamsoli]|uniref:cytochrome d ubiquinol oxidase subunit II n=1 Tax=Niabella insulamsoli TaxID=3144874 RepID=UPI0031FC6E0F